MSLERFTHRELVTVNPGHTVAEAARLMLDQHVGAVLVIEEGNAVGIVTDRDLTIRVLAEGLPASLPVGQVMTQELYVAHVGDPIDFAFNTMRRHGVRRLPIVDGDGALVGIVAMDDLLMLISGEVSSMAETVMDNRGP
jgi:CBS domain-containing protein